MRRAVAALIALGPSGLFLLAFFEGAGLPVPGGVDALIVFLASRNPQSLVLLVALAVVGSVLGNLILFALAKRGGEVYLHRHSLSRSGAHFRRWFQHYGLLTVFIAALVPLPIMPMKIFVVCSGALGVRRHAFIVTFVSARIPRYAMLAYLGASMGNDALLYLKQHVWQLVLFAAALFFVLYLVVKVADWRRAKAIDQSA
jgi:membrane protein YqaA with SNARE-associated domain